MAIQRADFSTPPPTRFLPSPDGKDPIALFSEHFELGSELLHIQSDIVNSLYRPGKLTGEQVVLRSIEIERSLEQWRRKLPAPYQKLFGGSMRLDRQQKVELVLANVTADRGITILKYGILRMFLLRAVFNNKLVSAHVRHKALHDGELILSEAIIKSNTFLASCHHGSQCSSDPRPTYSLSRGCFLCVANTDVCCSDDHPVRLYFQG